MSSGANKEENIPDEALPEEKKKDILKSCFLMENFIEKYINKYKRNVKSNYLKNLQSSKNPLQNDHKAMMENELSSNENDDEMDMEGEVQIRIAKSIISKPKDY